MSCSPATGKDTSRPSTRAMASCYGRHRWAATSSYAVDGKQYVAVAVAQALMPAAPRLIGALGRRPPERVPMSRGCPLGPAE